MTFCVKNNELYVKSYYIIKEKKNYLNLLLTLYHVSGGPISKDESLLH